MMYAGKYVNWLLAGIIWQFACLPPVHAGLALLQRETFRSVGTLNSTSPGSLGTVSGNFAKRPGGPRLASDTTAQSRGWSADTLLQNDAAHVINNSTAFPASTTFDNADGVFAFDWWVYLDAPASDGTRGKILCALTSSASGRTLFSVSTAGDGVSLSCGTESTVLGTFTTTPLAITLRQWTNLRVVWSKRAGGYYEYDVSLFARIPGGNWSVAAQLVDGKLFGNLSGLTAGFRNSGAAPLVRGRYGMPSLYQLGDWSERLLPIPDVVDPVPGPFTWYCNPATGNDGNDGTSPASAWASVVKINAESANLGMFGRKGYTAADSLVIDTSTSNLVLGTNSFYIATQGLNVTQIGGSAPGAGEIQAWAAIAPGSWTGPVSGTTKVYQTTLTETNLSCVIWENDKWLAHPKGTSLAAVQASLEAVPGSFWTNGATLYVHPFGNTNPASDGKTYTRSFHRGAPFGASAVMIVAPDTHLKDVRVRKTCLADMNTNDPVAAYCIQTVSQAGGTMLLENCVCSYGSKHIFGFSDNDLSRQYTINDCVAEQGSPYVSAGGQTAWVDYSAASGTGTATSTYNRCTTIKNGGAIGGTDGAVMLDQPAWLAHNNSSANFQFAAVNFNNCNFAGGLGTYGAAARVNFTGGSCLNAGMNNTAGVFSRVRFTGNPPTNSGSGGSVVARNCIIVVPYINGGGELAAQGLIDVQNCTFDLRAAVSNIDSIALYSRANALTMIWRNNVMLGSPMYRFGVVKNAVNTDALTFDHNIYQDVPLVAFNYNDGTLKSNRSFAQWQTLGKEAASFVVADVRVGGSLQLLADSPVIDAGYDAGPAADYTGANFSIRNDPGAYEYALPAFRAFPAPADVVEGTVLNLTAQVAGNGPFAWQWFKDGVAVPGAVAATLRIENTLPGQSGNYVVRVSNAAGSVSAASVAVVIHAMSFAQWRVARFTPEALQDLTISGASAASPDGSGLSNLAEYAFGVLPGANGNVPDGCVPLGEMINAVDGAHATIRYRRLVNVAGVTYNVEVSDDLASWDQSQNQLESIPAAVPTGDNRTEWVSMRLKVPGENLSGQSKFLRVRVAAADF